LTRALTDMSVDLDNTIIIFSSDNGGAPIVGGFNTPYRGGKAGAWEGGCRVAGFIRAPKLLGGGGRVWPGMAHVVDWAPTILSLVDGAPGKHALLDKLNDESDQGPIDGMDLSVALRESTASPRREALLVLDIYLNRTALVMRSPAKPDQEGAPESTWKLVMGYTGESKHAAPPTGRWSYDDPSFFDKFSETYRDSMMTLLGGERGASFLMALPSLPQAFEGLLEVISMLPAVEFYPFEWAFYFMLEGVTSTFTGSRDGVNPFGYWGAMAEMTSANVILPMEEWLPQPEWHHWEQFHTGLWLFNLDNDPYEKTNLAGSHRELVAALTARVHEVVALAPPQMCAVHFVFKQFMYLNGGVLYFLSLIFLVTSCCCCRCGYQRACGRRQELNAKSKQE